MDNEYKRWIELRFYYFCSDIFKIRHNLMDITYVIEALSNIGTLSTVRLQHLAVKTISDIGLTPKRSEFIKLASKYHYTNKQISVILNISTRQVQYSLNNDPEIITTAKLKDKDVIEIEKFLNLLDILRKAII